MSYTNLPPNLSSMFLQPSGSIYVVNSSIDVSNVPMSMGVSAAICPSESLLYLKMYQNNIPVIKAYQLTPYDSKSREHELENIVDQLTTKIEDLEKRLNTTEKQKPPVKKEVVHNGQ